MSADNGIYIAKFSDGEIRVTHAQAIENLSYGEPENAFFIYEYYKNQPCYSSLEEAFNKAEELSELIECEGYPLEYGVCILNFSRPFSYYENKSKTGKYDIYRES
jgi:hypothetical protein